MICCDICGEEIEPGEKRYNMPDGFTVCDDIDCLEKWAENYVGYIV